MKHTKDTAVEIAKMFGVQLANVKAQFAANAVSLRKDQAKAAQSKSGKLRGLTAEWFREAAEHAELQSR